MMNLGLLTASATITHQSDQPIVFALRNIGSVDFYSSYGRVVVVRSPIIFLRVAGEAVDVFGFEDGSGEAMFCDQEHGAADLLGGEDLGGKRLSHERKEWCQGRVEDSVRLRL